ncbi:polysaccharide biosynthesis/export family protein [Synoicihabitans lomoniglobus]|uniref:Polysaccharide export protein n=1 Tax=Synoicihabitans lomoniglobus TaxID=2909285 RepID=A0AAF0I570_9BACT|nr:polysaccharide export protein [Opitutaceae bacterium LMO-M01]WED67139.1 polysaccharide export protein [Opitutaceae bacterium LMO-M01]
MTQISPAQPAPAAFRPGPNSRAITYIIALTDRLRVAIFQEDDLSIISRVNAKGEVNLPLVGPVRVVGLTVEAAQDAIERAYQDGRFLRKPQVTISVEEYAAREVIVQGQVVSPGRVSLPIESGMTVLDAITKSGGFTDLAKGRAVTVTRTNPDGTKSVSTIDVQSAMVGKESASESEASMLLLPDDIVFVPMKFL